MAVVVVETEEVEGGGGVSKPPPHTNVGSGELTLAAASEPAIFRRLWT